MSGRKIPMLLLIENMTCPGICPQRSRPKIINYLYLKCQDKKGVILSHCISPLGVMNSGIGV